MIFLKKYMEIRYFFQMPRKHGFSKKIVLEYDLSCISGKMVFLFRRIWHFFSFDGKWKMIFLKKYMDIWYFLYICINFTNMILPFCKKKTTEMIFSQKNTLKSGWHARLHSRKSSNDSLYFYGDLHRSFHILLSSQKSQEN